MVTDAQLERLIKEIKEDYKEKLKNVFGELRLLSNEPCSHFFGKTTYKVEMTFSEWYAFEKRHLGEDV